MKIVKEILYTVMESFILKMDSIVLRFVCEYDFTDRLSRTITNYKVEITMFNSSFVKKYKKNSMSNVFYTIYWKGDFFIDIFLCAEKKYLNIFLVYVTHKF